MYAGQKGKGLVSLCMGSGILLSLLLSQSWVTTGLLGFAYAMVIIPSAFDVYRYANGQTQAGTSDSKLYIIMMLFLTGLFGLPLLWQGKTFSKNVKLLWTIIVILLAILFLSTIILMGPVIEKYVEENIMKLSS